MTRAPRSLTYHCAAHCGAVVDGPDRVCLACCAPPVCRRVVVLKSGDTHRSYPVDHDRELPREFVLDGRRWTVVADTREVRG